MKSLMEEYLTSNPEKITVVKNDFTTEGILDLVRNIIDVRFESAHRTKIAIIVPVYENIDISHTKDIKIDEYSVMNALLTPTESMINNGKDMVSHEQSPDMTDFHSLGIRFHVVTQMILDEYSAKMTNNQISVFYVDRGDIISPNTRYRKLLEYINSNGYEHMFCFSVENYPYTINSVFDSDVAKRNIPHITVINIVSKEDITSGSNDSQDYINFIESLEKSCLIKFNNDEPIIKMNAGFYHIDIMSSYRTTSINLRDDIKEIFDID